MMTTQEPDGDFHARPMSMHEMDPDGTLFEMAKGTLAGQPDTSGRNEKLGDQPR